MSAAADAPARETGPPTPVVGSVLVADTDSVSSRALVAQLELRGHRAAVVEDVRSAVPAARRHQPDIVVLDLEAPGAGDLDIIPELLHSSAAPRIVLAGRGSPVERIAALRLGADDYVHKPFDRGEMVARVEAILRRCPRPLAPVLSFDGLEIDPHARRVIRDGFELTLSTREFDLLEFLARRAGRAFSREQLLDALWKWSYYTDDSTVTVHMYRLRRKLELDTAAPRWLQTVRGVGYRFHAGPVSAV